MDASWCMRRSKDLRSGAPASLGAVSMHAGELQWQTIEGGVKVANLIDFRMRFQYTLVNIAISEIPPHSQASVGHTPWGGLHLFHSR